MCSHRQQYTCAPPEHETLCMPFRRFLPSFFRPRPTVMRGEDFVVFVIGATGAGKSKLAIDIASHLKGEVINADALQVRSQLLCHSPPAPAYSDRPQLYTGLDIVTNKVTVEEQNLAKHHLLGFADPVTPLTVVDFKKLALPIVSIAMRVPQTSLFKQFLPHHLLIPFNWNLQMKDLLSRGTTPIVAGGTMYYIESLLWNVLVDDGSESEEFLFAEDRKVEQQLSDPEFPLTAENIFHQPILASSFKTVAAPELYKILQQLDPEAANSFHPNAKRKIIRSLQVIQRHKAKYSEVLKEQMSQRGGSSLGGSLKYPNAVIFWTQSEEAVLNQRLDERVDQMLERGLLQELNAFHSHYDHKMSEHGLKADYTQGIFQAIGFKEFHEYLRLPCDKRSDKLLRKCVEEMKLRTRIYARKQIKWIRNRFIYACDRQVPPIFAVDTTDPDNWNVAVRDRSLRILSHLHDGGELPIDLQPLPQMVRPESLRNEKGIMFCEVCDRTFQGTFQYNAHLKSKSHQAACAGKKALSME